MTFGDDFAYPNQETQEWARSTGLTKRELFAAMAMQGLIGTDLSGSAADLAVVSIQAADALIAELSK